MNVISFLKSLIREKDIINIEKDNSMFAEGLWDSNNKTIYINEKLIAESAVEKGMNLQDYAYIVYLHELGHALDPELSSLDSIINKLLKNIKERGFREEWFEEYRLNKIKIEKNAWEIPIEIIDKSLIQDYLKCKSDTLNELNKILDLQKQTLIIDYKSDLLQGENTI